MNIVAAAKTKRPFRRPEDVAVYGESFWVDLTTEKTVALGYEDLVADDWEVQPKAADETIIYIDSWLDDDGNLCFKKLDGTIMKFTNPRIKGVSSEVKSGPGIKVEKFEFVARKE